MGVGLCYCEEARTTLPFVGMVWESPRCAGKATGGFFFAFISTYLPLCVDLLNTYPRLDIGGCFQQSSTEEGADHPVLLCAVGFRLELVHQRLDYPQHPGQLLVNQRREADLARDPFRHRAESSVNLRVQCERHLLLGVRHASIIARSQSV